MYCGLLSSLSSALRVTRTLTGTPAFRQLRVCLGLRIHTPSSSTNGTDVTTTPFDQLLTSDLHVDR